MNIACAFIWNILFPMLSILIASYIYCHKEKELLDTLNGSDSMVLSIVLLGVQW